MPEREPNGTLRCDFHRRARIEPLKTATTAEGTEMRRVGGGSGRVMGWRWALVVALLAGACAPDPASIAENPAAPRLELVARAGCADCDDASAITAMAMAIRDDGGLAVLDRYEPFVRLFDAAGELEAAFGAPGQGPGELGMSSAVGYIPGIWIFSNELGGATVVDVMPAALAVFDATGGFVGRPTLELTDAVPVAQAFDPVTWTYFRSSFSFAGGGVVPAISYCRLVPAEAPECRDFTDPAPFLHAEGPGSRVGGLALAATGEGNLVIAHQASYEIWVLNGAAEIVLRTGRNLPPPPKSAVELEREREVAASRGRADSSIDPNRPHILPGGIQVDGVGRLWVLTARYGDGDSVFDLFASDGTFLAEVTLDVPIRNNGRTATPFAVRGNTLAGIVTQPDGDDQIWLFRIVE